MSDFNADPVPNHGQANVLITNLLSVPNRPLYFDQWTIDSTNRVNSYHNGTGHIKLHVRYDPTQFPT